MGTELAERLAAQAGLPERVDAVRFLDKGYSFDRKYVFEAAGEPRFLMRIGSAEEARVRREEFEHVGLLAAAGVKCPAAHAFGVSEEAGVCWSVLDYVAGDCAEDAIPALSPPDRYAVGLQAGEQLARIHRAIEPPGQVDDWSIRREKAERARRDAAELGLDFAGRERAERFLDANLHVLKGRPTAFRHGDFHPGNLIVQGSELAGVIDFNRSDFGDPFDDFYKTAWFGAPLSAEYAGGLLRAYFGCEPDDRFWRIYNVYVAAVLPADLVWTYRLYPADLERSHALVELIAATHDFESGGPPQWWPG